MSRVEKQALRRAVRMRFPGPEARARESALICRHICAWPDYRAAKIVAGYMPLAWEADITPVMRDALTTGKTLLLPRVEGEHEMTLRRVDDLDKLVINRWGLAEPPDDAKVVSPWRALVLVPLEAIDGTGMRLGKGGGYYDRLLQAGGALTLGPVLSWQWVERVPSEAWDRPLAAAADDKGIQLFK